MQEKISVEIHAAEALEACSAGCDFCCTRLCKKEWAGQQKEAGAFYK